MGYIRNECMVVSGWDSKRVLTAHEAATVIFDEHKLGSLVSGLVQHTANGGAAFFISPDGSKEGWEPSDRAEIARGKFVEFLKSNRDLYLDWCLLLIGGDDGEFSVLASPNNEEAGTFDHEALARDNDHEDQLTIQCGDALTDQMLADNERRSLIASLTAACNELERHGYVMAAGLYRQALPEDATPAGD